MNPVDEANKYLTRWSDNRFYLLVLAILTLITATVATVFVLVIQRNFLTITCDTAFYQSGIVNLIHGNGFRDTAYDGPNVLGNHTTFVLILLAPIYALLPSPDTLFKLQVWGVYSTVLPLRFPDCRLGAGESALSAYGRRAFSSGNLDGGGNSLVHLLLPAQSSHRLLDQLLFCGQLQ